MKRHHLLLIVAAVALSIYSGCSEDNLLNGPSGSYPSGMPLSAPFSIVGPSDVVMCIDVSDSISADELSAAIGALGGSLSDPDLVPQDGVIAVAAIVYGDTTETLYGLTPVTADNLANIILPGLQGLLTDRIVGGAGFDLSGALTKAGAILNASGSPDDHVLIMGSGAAEYPDSATAICTALGEAGVMVSAVGVAPDDSGNALLEGCALDTGGFYGAGATGIEDLSDEAFAYMLHVDIDMEPETQERLRGEDHTVEAIIFRGMDRESYPVAGLEMTIAVIGGPNIGESTTEPTGTDGKVTFTFNGDGGPGTDTLLASASHPGTGTAMLDTVTVTWLNTPPVCDAGGPYDLTVSSDTATVTLDATGSSDADGDSLTFHWSADCSEVTFDDATSSTPSITITGDCLCVESFMVEVMVSDGYDTTTFYSAVNIDDQRPPVLVVKEEPVVLWPPNHKHRKITPDMLLEYAEDACGRPIDISGAVIISVTSDEPEDHKGDGKTVDDIRIGCPNHLKLRAERMGSGNGRVYAVIYQITAENGVSTSAEALVIVPHDASDPHAVRDGDGGYEVVQECSD